MQSSNFFFLQPTNILCWRTQNCLLASFYRCVYLLTNINHREYGKLAIKIIRHFLIRNEHLCVCVLVCLLITSYPFPVGAQKRIDFYDRKWRKRHIENISFRLALIKAKERKRKTFELGIECMNLSEVVDVFWE